jgi:hypothetical protein
MITLSATVRSFRHQFQARPSSSHRHGASSINSKFQMSLGTLLSASATIASRLRRCGSSVVMCELCLHQPLAPAQRHPLRATSAATHFASRVALAIAAFARDHVKQAKKALAPNAG